MRIVSLLPSATEIVCELGLGSQLVGVTHECDHPAEVRSIRKVTRTLIPMDAGSAEIDRLVREQRSGKQALYSLDFDAMRALRPDLVVTQTLCDVCAVDDREVRAFAVAATADGLRTPKVVYLEPTRLADVLDNIREVAIAADAVERGQIAVARLRARMDRARTGAAAHSQRPRVAVLEWLDPLFSSGHWTPEIVELAGGMEPLARPGARSRRIDEHELAAAD